MDRRWAYERSAPQSLLYLGRRVRERAQRVRVLGDRLVVVLSVLNVVPADDFDLAYVGILLPLPRGSETVYGDSDTNAHGEKVDFLEELLFVVFEFSDHYYLT